MVRSEVRSLMNMPDVKKILCLVCFLISSICQAEEILKINADPTDPTAPYAVKMLELALSHIERPYKVQTSYEKYTQSKTNEELKNNGLINLIWEASDKTMEEEFRPIRICLYKGLLGYRILIINKKNQEKFDRVTTLDQLKQLSFGQGRFWADTRILEANQFKVVKVTKYTNIFFMVDGDRFDAFPRGVLEPFNELAKRPQLPDLTVEKNLMIVYKMPFYFFVAKDNQRLANDLELGLNRAIADGSFDKTFFGDPSIQDVIQKANMKNRRIFNIDNPVLSDATPLSRTELWLDPKTLP
jgi:hypothetical protein